VQVTKVGSLLTKFELTDFRPIYFQFVVVKRLLNKTAKMKNG